MIDIKIEEALFPAIGIGVHEDKKVRVKNAIEGEIVRVRLKRKRKKVDAQRIVTLERSPLETEAPCPHQEYCGGCLYQTLSYERELTYKEKQMKKLFSKYKDIYKGVRPVGSPDGYRNKMEFTFGNMEMDGPLTLGLHVRGHFHSIVEVSECRICDGDFREILTGVSKYFKDKGKVHYNRRTHKGFLRHLVIRKAHTTGEILVNLSTSSQDKLDDDLVDFLLELELEGKIKSVYHSINDGLGDTVASDNQTVLYGRAYINEIIEGFKFKVSPSSFFQTNSLGAIELYEKAIETLGDISSKTVFDLYSGTGTIASLLSKKAEKVYAVEIVEDAVTRGREALKENGINNVNFLQGDVFEVLDSLDYGPEIIVVDPPREGVVEKSLRKILNFSPEKFLYISCNPLTLARDLEIFEESGYKPLSIESFDMFPRTPNLETVVLLEKGVEIN